VRALSILALLVGLGFCAPPAYADTPGCVTRAEYREIERGMTVAFVARIFDTNGRVVATIRDGRHLTVARSYDACRSRGRVGVVFSNRTGRLRVTDKTAVW